MKTLSHPAGAEAKQPSAAGLNNSTALDQWRGLALVFVLISHGFYFTGHVYGLGRVGVNLFFFISGVLVFKSLTGHHDKTAWERTRHFWQRRARRLYPALVTYVLVMTPIVFALRNVPGAVTASMPEYLGSAPFALIYAINYWPVDAAWSLGHLWSLACEMQFYLIAPVIFLWGGKTSTQRNMVWGALLLALAFWGLIGGTLVEGDRYKYHFEISAWPLMLGFFCEYRKDLFQRIPTRWFRGIILASIIAFGAMSVVMFCGFEMKYLVVAIGTFAFIPCFLAYLGNRTLGGPAGRLMTWLGERTYSIYLWQEPLTVCNYLPSILHPVGAIASSLIGGIWFRFFEHPFLSPKRQRAASASVLSGKG
jgi:peptidoglycan/LPS O-acetylase OafA/YrhL